MKMHEFMFRANLWNMMIELFEDDYKVFADREGYGKRMVWKFTEDERNAVNRLMRELGQYGGSVPAGYIGRCSLVRHDV